MAVVLTLAASAPAAFAATDPGVTSSQIVENRNSEENILIEFDLETGEEKEVIVKSSPDNAVRFSPATVDVPEMYELTGGASASSLTADADEWKSNEVVAWNYFAPLCKLQITFNDGTTGQASGFIVGKNTVVTAGHCLKYRDKETGQLRTATKVVAIPKKRADKQPFGAFETTKLAIPKKWSENENYNYDYGIITVNTNIEAIVGSKFGYRDNTNISLQGKTITAIGYPDFAENFQYIDSGSVKTVNSYTLLHGARTDRGQSGGPVYIQKGVADGINSISDFKSTSTAVRINKEIYDAISLYAK